MAHKRPTGAPTDLSRITEKQFAILAWVYVAGYRTAADIYITWSPKAFLNRSPTKAEAATLSQRVKSLVERGLLERHGRELTITDAGKTWLSIYAAERAGNPFYDSLLARVELDNAVFGLGFSQQLVPTLIAVHRDELGLEQSEAVDAAHKLSSALNRHNIKQARKALERFRDAQKRQLEAVTSENLE